MQLSPYYPAIVDYCRTWRTVNDVATHCDQIGVGVGHSGVRQALRRWTEAGAFTRTDSNPRRYRATNVATDPGVMTRAIGQRAASRALTVVAPPKEDAHEVKVASDTRQLSPERIERLVKIASDFPQDLFTATFGPNGVTISYDQFHRVIALLNAVTTA